MGIARLWAGRAFGTNTGDLFVKFEEGEDDALQGTLRLSDAVYGLTIYRISGSFDGSQLIAKGKPESDREGVTYGDLTVSAKLGPKGELAGEWETTIGSAGTFVLFPHDRNETDVTQTLRRPEQLHTANHIFAAIEIDREQLVAVAESLQQEFSNKVVITWRSGTEQSRYVADFKTMDISPSRAEVMKIRVSDPDTGGVNRVILIEFGPFENSVMTQGADEAWVRGKREQLKEELRRFERVYATNIKRMGFGVTQLLFFLVLTFLPSLETIRDRAVFLGAVMLLNWGVTKFHNRFLPHAAIYLSKRQPGLFRVIGPSVLSWIVSILATALATLLAVYMDGWLRAWFEQPPPPT